MLAAAAAFADGVSSSNVVGYNTVEVPNQYTVLGVNFNGIGGGALSLQDAVPYVEGMTKGNNASVADSIQIQNAAGGWDIYYLSNGRNAKNTATIAGLEGKWAKSGQYTPTTDTVASGKAFWYIRQSTDADLSLTVAGEVDLLSSATNKVDLAYKFISNKYPDDLPLNDGIPYVEGMTKGNNASVADSIQIQNAEGGWDIYYLSNGRNAKNTATIAGLEGKWAKSGQYTPATDAAIPADKGAWYIRKGETDFNLTITRPFEL